MAIDQTRRAVGCDQYRAWFPNGERVRLLCLNTYDGIKLFGVLTDPNETFVTEIADSSTSDVRIEPLHALQVKFGDYHVVISNTMCFTSNAVKEFVEDSAIEVSYPPPESPGMNPIEECWRQFKHSLGNRFSGSFDELRPAIWAAIDSSLFIIYAIGYVRMYWYRDIRQKLWERRSEVFL